MPETIYEKVRETVARCIPDNRLLRIRRVSTEIVACLSEEDLSPEIVPQELLAAGVAARLPIEIETPSGDDGSSRSSQSHTAGEA
jgi:hypothetical protein